MRLYLLIFLVGWCNACFENMRCQGTIIIKRDVPQEEPEKTVAPGSCSSLTKTLKKGMEAFCDRGWTVFQKNTSPDISFDQSWASYEKGFSNLDDSFWLGLAKVHSMTQNRTCRLRVDLWTSGNTHTYAEYSSFSIGSESDKYRLHLSGFNGTLSDSLNYHNSSIPFTTKDQDNDVWRKGNCAKRHGAGWWYYKCGMAILNRPFGSLRWKFNGTQYQSSTMKFRCE